MRDFSSRHPGLDLARNLAVFLVIVQHLAFLGGLSNDGMSEAHRLQARFLEALSQCCVDLFGLISGYLGVTATGWKWRKFGRLWWQVWSTGLLVLGACTVVGLACPAAFGGHLPTPDDWLTAAFPLLRDEYWYFTGYFLVFLVAPLLNRHFFSEGREGRGYALAGVLFAVVCGSTVFPGGAAALPLAKGYSGAWLVCLYAFGAALRRLDGRLSCVRSCTFLAVAALGVSVTVLQRCAMASVPALKTLFADEWTLSHYTSPTVTLVAAALLLGCASLRPSQVHGRLVRASALLSSCAFGVYLLHVQPFFFRWGFKFQFAFLDRVPDGLFAVAVLAQAAVLYAFLSALEFGRRKLLSLSMGFVRQI